MAATHPGERGWIVAWPILRCGGLCGTGGDQSRGERRSGRGRDAIDEIPPRDRPVHAQHPLARGPLVSHAILLAVPAGKSLRRCRKLNLAAGAAWAIVPVIVANVVQWQLSAVPANTFCGHADELFQLA